MLKNDSGWVESKVCFLDDQDPKQKKFILDVLQGGIDNYSHRFLSIQKKREF